MLFQVNVEEMLVFSEVENRIGKDKRIFKFKIEAVWKDTFSG